jgi:hypothetical protein
MSNPANEQWEEQDYEESLCPRCKCCDTDWVECYQCGAEGGRGYDDDLQFEDPMWYQPGDWEECDICEGKGGWSVCLGNCDENGKHKT